MNVNESQPKRYILDIWHGSEYAYEEWMLVKSIAFFKYSFYLFFLAFSGSTKMLIIETLEQCVKYVQS